MNLVDTNMVTRQAMLHLRPLRKEVVILDTDLEWFLEFNAGELLRIVEKHPNAFPDDFVFRLTSAELAEFERKSPCMTGSAVPTGKPRLAFTSQGAGMLLAVVADEKFALKAIPVLRAYAHFWNQAVKKSPAAGKIKP
jgi:ORF6N domain